MDIYFANYSQSCNEHAYPVHSQFILQHHYREQISSGPGVTATPYERLTLIKAKPSPEARPFHLLIVKMLRTAHHLLMIDSVVLWML